MSKPGQPSTTAKVADVIAHFAPTRRFGATTTHKPYYVTSLDFDDTGELALVAQDDETIQIYNCKEGKHAKELKSQKYGADIARFTHHSQNILYASTKTDDAIRYLSAHDNSYIRYFRGHHGPVNCIALNPSCDEFLSSSLDGTVRIWDLRSASPQGQLNLASPAQCAYDPTATVIAVACPTAQSILLYDVRNYDKAPFQTFDVQSFEREFSQSGSMQIDSTGPVPNNWTKLEFSNDGKKLLLATNGGGHYLLDSFYGKLMGYCAKPQGPTNRISPSSLAEFRERQKSSDKGGVDTGSTGQGDACFSPDGRYVIGGSGDSGLYTWDTNGRDEEQLANATTFERTLQPNGDLSKKSAGTAAIVAYNPKHNLIVTADRNVVFWLPESD